MSDLQCVRCFQTRTNRELDRLLWCEDCVRIARKRAARRGWISGAVLLGLAALYILLWIRPDPSLIPTVWIALAAGVFYLGARVAREAFFGWDRISNQPGAEAGRASGREGADPAG